MIRIKPPVVVIPRESVLEVSVREISLGRGAVNAKRRINRPDTSDPDAASG
jgi:hypothetical protein